MRSLILGLCAMAMLSGCVTSQKPDIGEHRVLEDGGMAYSWVEADQKWLTNTPLFKPRPCTIGELQEFTLKFPREKPWWQFWGPQPSNKYWACPLTDWELKEKRWAPVEVAYDTSIIEKLGPMIHGAAFLGGTLGAASILGGHIEGGLRGQATGNSGPNLYASTISGQPIPGLRFVRP